MTFYEADIKKYLFAYLYQYGIFDGEFNTRKTCNIKRSQNTLPKMSNLGCYQLQFSACNL